MPIGSTRVKTRVTISSTGGFIVTGGFGPAHDVGEGDPEHELAIDTIRFWLLHDHER
jgi:hypothetical protein